MRASRAPSRRRPAGFTIIELMTTLVVLGVLITLAVPSFNDLILSSRVKGGASDIYGTLSLARSEAIKRNGTITITPVSGQWVNGWQVKSGSTVLASHGALTNLRVDCPSGTACTQTLTYARTGRLTSGTVTLVVDITNPPTPRRVPMRCVTIDLSGRVNVTADNNKDGNCANG
jgi:type IV fimbrial biogenesis protein FimT